MHSKELQVELRQGQKVLPLAVLPRHQVLVPDELLRGVQRHGINLSQMEVALLKPEEDKLRKKLLV